MFDLLADLIEDIARAGAGMPSIGPSYQPKTPACLVDGDAQ